MAGERNNNQQTSLATVAPLLGLPSAELVSDGGTVNRRVEWSLGGSGGLTVLPFEFDVPKANPVADAFIGAFTATGTGILLDASHSLFFFVSTTGGLAIRATGALSTDRRQFLYAGFRAKYSGKRVRGLISWPTSDTVENPQCYVLGENISASFASSTQGDAPNWLAPSLDTSMFLSGRDWPVGRFVPHAPIIGAFTEAEAIEWTLGGRLPSWCDLGTGNAEPDYSLSFAGSMPGAISFSFDVSNLVGTSNVDGVHEEDDWLKVERINTTGTLAFSVLSFYQAGRSRRAYVRIYNPPGSVCEYYRVGQYNGTIADGTVFFFHVPAGTVKDCAVSFTSKVYASGERLFVRSCDASGSSLSVPAGEVFYAKNIERAENGPIFRPVIQPARVVADGGANAIPGILTAGITPICPGKRDFVIQAKTSTNGNAQLFGTGVAPFLDRTKVVLRDYVANNKGSNSRTISLGTTSGGTQLVNGATAAVGLNTPALAARTLGANALFVASDGDDELQHTITGFVVD